MVTMSNAHVHAAELRTFSGLLTLSPGSPLVFMGYVENTESALPPDVQLLTVRVDELLTVTVASPCISSVTCIYTTEGGTGQNTL